MSHNPNEPRSLPEVEATEARQSALAARRRLLRGGLSAAPVLLVSAPRSVMASACTTSSAAGSIQVSGPADKIYMCSGQPPSYWVNNPILWPSPYVAVASGSLVSPTLFDTALGCTSICAGKTMLDVLKLPATTGNEGLAKLIAASLLNATAGKTTGVLSPSLVKDIWRTYVRKGWWEPTGGIKWYADYSKPVGSGGCIAWLTSTMS